MLRPRRIGSKSVGARKEAAKVTASGSSCVIAGSAVDS